MRLQQEFPDGVIQFEHHMVDALSFPAAMDRAEWYGVTAIPNVRIDGERAVVGASDCACAYMNYRQEVEYRLRETESRSPIGITGSFRVSDSPLPEIHAEATFRLLEPESLSDLRASLIVYEDDVFYCCGHDEVDTWDNVGRAILDQPIKLTEAWESVSMERVIPIPQGPDPWDVWDASNLHMVAYVQNTSTKEVIQAARLEVLRPFFTDSLPETRLLYVQPNPIVANARIGFRVVGEPVPSELSVFDARGRKVTTLHRGIATAGLHVITWPDVDEGPPLPHGVYFVRLVSGDHTQIRKVVRID